MQQGNYGAQLNMLLKHKFKILRCIIILLNPIVSYHIASYFFGRVFLYTYSPLTHDILILMIYCTILVAVNEIPQDKDRPV